jgi:hypothetical protein
MRVSGPFEILSKRSLLRHTGHSRQHALRMMMVMPMMKVKHAHLPFRVTFELSEVNLIWNDQRSLSTKHRSTNLHIDASRTLS